MTVRWFLPLLMGLSVLAFEQHVLTNEDTHTGVLRRFSVTGSSLEDILRLASEHDLDVWQVARSHVDIYSSRDRLPEALQRVSHTTTPVLTPPRRRQGLVNSTWDFGTLENTTYHDVYHPLFEIDEFLRQLSKLHPNTTRLTNLGHTGQGREMMALTISNTEHNETQTMTTKKRKKGKKNRNGDGKLGFVIVGAQHAREWIATATSLYLAHALLSDPSSPNSLSHLLDVFDFHIIPVPNPDGYDYTWEYDRYWYKNRQVTSPRAKCVGLDMNRNWGYKWQPDVPASAGNFTKPKEPTDPCSHWYPGSRPFEAPEVNNIANFVATLPDLIGFLDLRSYGQMLSTPYSYSCKRIPKAAEDLTEAALGAVQALGFVHGTTFQTGTLCRMLYRAPGNILDWMYNRAGIKFSYVAHLRDTGTYGFSLPEREIRPVGEETGSMVKYLATFIAKSNHRKL